MTENLMALADAYADACFKQGLNAQPEDPQPEIARSLLLDGIEQLQDEIVSAKDEIERLRWSVHSCGSTCTKDGCVNRRLMESKTMDEALMRQALDALEQFGSDESPEGWNAIEAINALRGRLK